jgi:hypothetical protein
MPPTRLVYRFNAKTETPRLEDATGQVAQNELSSWEAELDRRATQQSLTRGDVITFASPVRNLPLCYRVRTEAGETSRYPTFHLDPVSSSLVANELAPADWQQGLLAELKARMGKIKATRTGRHGIEFVVEELNDLIDDRPDDAGLVLLAAFAVVRQLTCPEIPTEDLKEHFYSLALEALAPHLAEAVARAEAKPEKNRTGVLGVLSRLLGQ